MPHTHRVCRSLAVGLIVHFQRKASASSVSLKSSSVV